MTFFPNISEGLLSGRGTGRFSCPCLTSVFFQTLLQYCFVCLLKHIVAVLGREKVYSLELATTNTRRGLVINFWEAMIWWRWQLLLAAVMSLWSSVVCYFVQKCGLLFCWKRLLFFLGRGEGSAEFITALDKTRIETPVYSILVLCTLLNWEIHTQTEFECNGQDRHVLDGSHATCEIVGSVGWKFNSVDAVSP